MHDARSVYTVDRGHPQNVIFQQPTRVVDFFHSFRIHRFSPVFSGFIPVRYIFPHIKPLILHRFSTLWITPVDIGVNLCIVWVKS